MTVQAKWQVARGEDLVEAAGSGSMRDVVPDRSAVYLWKRNLRDVNLFKTDPDGLVDWLAAELIVPNGRVRQQRIGHFLSLATLELRSQGMTKDKRTRLRKFVQKPASRQWIMSYLHQLAVHVPALYVGETGNIRIRAEAHLRGDTEFGNDVATAVDLSWNALDLFYFDMGEPRDEPNEIRKTIEYITTALTIGGYTRRPG